jgi:hypothetical protein
MQSDKELSSETKMITQNMNFNQEAKSLLKKLHKQNWDNISSEIIFDDENYTQKQIQSGWHLRKKIGKSMTVKSSPKRNFQSRTTENQARMRKNRIGSPENETQCDPCLKYKKNLEMSKLILMTRKLYEGKRRRRVASGDMSDLTEVQNKKRRKEIKERNIRLRNKIKEIEKKVDYNNKKLSKMIVQQSSDTKFPNVTLDWMGKKVGGRPEDPAHAATSPKDNTQQPTLNQYHPKIIRNHSLITYKTCEKLFSLKQIGSEKTPMPTEISQAVTGYPSGVKAWIIFNESFNINNDTLQMRVAKGLMNHNKAFKQGQITQSTFKSKPKKLAPIKWLFNTSGTDNTDSGYVRIMDYVFRLDIYPGYIADCQARGIQKELRTTDYPIFTGLSQFKR